MAETVVVALISAGATLIVCLINNAFQAEKAEKEILNQLEEIKNGNFSDEDMKNSVLSILNSLKGVGDTTSSYVGWYFNCYAYGETKEPDVV